MSTSSPADLAIAFRSLARRLEDASADAPPAAVTTARSAVEASIGAVAPLLGCGASTEAVAAAIAARRPEDWSSSDLGTIQASADAAARAIRTLADLADS